MGWMDGEHPNCELCLSGQPLEERVDEVSAERELEREGCTAAVASV